MGFDFASMRENFFDSEKVLRDMDAKERRMLSRAGSFVRTRARSSLRYRNSPSSPGSPPSVHRGGLIRTTTNKKTGETKQRSTSPLKELLFFSFDPTRKTTIVGPALFRASSKLIEGLEHGGVISGTRAAERGAVRKATARQAESYRSKIADGSIVPAKRERVRVAINVAKRPTMVPALLAEAPKFAALLKG